LVSAQTTHGVLLPRRVPQSFSDDSQELISGRVAKAVVDMLKAVDVDEKSACFRAWPACHPGEHLLGAVEHECAVRQPGECVVKSLMRELAVLVGEFAGLLAHQRQRSGASGTEDDHQQAEHEA